MSTRTVERVDGWESVPFEGGFAGLQQLAAQEFSGAVITGPTRLFMLNGTVVGILDGSIEDFEGASGTAKQSPHEALPLLAVMQERADEVKAQYYTEDTELAEVDRTLSSGNFTGFIELSENVLSGDYYTVYHQGRSMSVAWVGNADKLLTDDEAFDTANDEVGIYEVMPVDIEPIEIPEPAEESTAAGSGATVTETPDAGDESSPEPGNPDSESEDGATTSATTATDPTDSPAATTDSIEGSSESESEPDSSRRRGPAGGGPPGSKAAGANPGGSQRNRETDDHPAAGVAGRDETETDTQPAPETERDSDHPAAERDTTGRGEAATRSDTTDRTDASDTDAAARTDAKTRTEPADSGAEPAQRDERAQSSARSAPAETTQQTADGSTAQSTPERPETGPTQTETTATSTEPAGGASGASADLETRSIPSLDPNKSGGAQASEPANVSATQAPPSGSTQASTPRRDQPAADTASDTDTTEPTPAAGSTEPAETADSEPAPTQTQPPAADQPQPAGGAGATPQNGDRVAELESELEAKTATVSELEAELTDLEATNRDLRAEVDRLETDLADARAEIERLEEQLDAQDDGSAGGTRLGVSEAINGTNLFVRYNSKGKATLEEAKNGEASREDVEANIRLEYHTQFEAEDATVNGTPFQEFLEDSIQYRFVNWLIRNLLYEIRDTGHAGAMKDLYEGLPAIDRAELNGKVTVTYMEDGQENRSQEQFDVVVRDRMGNPLVVANINDSREPATEGQMTDLVRNAERVGNASDSFASAFLVTSSFFEPGALETAKEATSSGLFNRDKRKSFVNLSRKEGFHLCLLEARNQEFHLAVPEL